jgi:hypothetical protein
MDEALWETFQFSHQVESYNPLIHFGKNDRFVYHQTNRPKELDVNILLSQS